MKFLKVIAVVLGSILLAQVFIGLAKAQQVIANCQPGASTNCTSRAAPLGITSTAVESSHVFKATAGTLSGFQVNNTNASLRWVILYNATSAPSNGAVTGCGNTTQTAPCAVKWYQVGSTSTIGVTWSPGPPLNFQSGIVVTCSSTGPFTLTLAADCTFSGEIN